MANFKKITLIMCLVLMGFSGPAAAQFQEPSIADYTTYPIFVGDQPQPNIMIILDNSGSMNFNAYGTWPGNNGNVSDAPFTGEPYSGIKSFQIVSGQDDAEEGVAAGSVLYHNNTDLDLGGWSVAANDSLVGLRFQNVAIPPGAVVHNAYIEFRANATNSEISNFLIEGEASADANPFSTVADDLKSPARAFTTAKVNWDDVVPWTAGQSYPSPDIAAIIQEIIDTDGWASGNSLVLRISPNGTTDNKRDVRAFDANNSTAPILHVVFGNDPGATRYYGLFNPDYFYKYDGSKFVHAYKKIGYGTSTWKVENLAGNSDSLSNTNIVTNELWDGNWLNWLCMRRIDVLRKVLMGGKATARTGGGNQVNYGENPVQNGRNFYKTFNSSIRSAVSPYHGNFSYNMDDGEIVVDGDRYNIRVQKDITKEPEDFMADGNLSGVLQRVGDLARWGNIWFNDGSGWNQSGGTVAATIGTNMTSLITDLQNTGCDTWTPLAETFYVAMQYFKQKDPESGLDYPNNAVPNSNLGDDPWYVDNQYVECAKSFVILLTDGASTKDAKIPNEFKDYDGDGDSKSCDESAETNCDYPDGGTDFLDDLALYAHTEDLRSDLDEVQTLDLYTIYAFGDDDNARQLLKDAARNGGFVDMNGSKTPDKVQEWDKDGDGVPDTFFEATDGYALEAQLMKAILDIMDKAASGTSASVLATNSEGEGNMVQAYFRPVTRAENSLDEANWLGYLQSLWIDSSGILYENTNPGPSFDSGDRPIVFATNVEGDTGFSYADDSGDKFHELKDLKPIFETNQLLSDRDPDTRRIFTFIDKDKDDIADDSGSDPFDVAGEVVTFDTGISEAVKPYFGVRADTAWGDNGAGLGTTLDERVENIITWVRGTDVSGLRNRTLDGVTWRLGDIVHSTPVTISSPPEKFHIWYADHLYEKFFNLYRDREAVVYVGSNDGMLHAFTSWKYDVKNKKYIKPSGTTERLGDEIWAFIPQSVLPHLKWVSQKNYTHTNLVDSKPRIFDARIIANNTHYSDGDPGDDWGTILVMGLNMGARQIDVKEDFGTGSAEQRTFYPTYICMDITEPRKPRLLWERTYPNLASSRSTPSPVKVGDRWYLVFGSGPMEYDGTSSQEGYIYVADMKTGAMLKRFGPYDKDAFFGTAASLDKNLNFNVDSIYIGNTYFDQNQWKGSLYKIAIDCSNCQWDAGYNPDQPLGYNTDPTTWTAQKLFDSDSPITAPPSISVEVASEIGVDNVWVYFGTGRYIGQADKTDNQQQYLYAVKDPFFNAKKYNGSALYDYSQAAGLTLDRDDLFQSDVITVTTSGHVLKNGSLFKTGEFQDLVDEIRGKDPNTDPGWDGWYRKLDLNGTAASERMISKPAILGGISFFPVYTPNADICGFGGNTNLYALYFLTGTGYTKQIFNVSDKSYVNVTISGQTNKEEVVEVKLKSSLLGSPPPSIGMHSGAEDGAKAFMQQSTGKVIEVDVGLAHYSKSNLTEWWDRIDSPPQDAK